ncbi:MAG: hypothetical protein JWL77_532 [Chthonomonadaceae bacterium]|nr:hypothetical protein [Chthonomonadaceae bacterium]
MKSVLLLLLILLISSGFGRVLLTRFTVLKDSPLERFAYSTAIGLAVAAMGVFVLGSLGQLSFVPITALWLVMAAIGSIGVLHNLRDVLQSTAHGRPNRILQQSGGADLTYGNLIAPLTILVLIAAALFCVCACFQPPTGHEWDVLAYHLADPKVFLAQHRITMLPTEHHSNFPFLMEMLYCVALLYDNFPLANLLHLTMGMLTLVAVLGFCRRIMPGHAGWIAVLLLVTTPLFLWECSVAYIDVGMGLYVTLAAFAGTMMIETMHRSSLDATETSLEIAPQSAAVMQRRLREWGILAGTATGFALGIKYLALIPFALLPLLLLYRRVPMRQVLTVVGVAALIGSPWYLKNIVVTHNPVYPYLFKLFPASLYWSADRAAAYQSEQGGFGYSHSLSLSGTPTDNIFLTISNLFQTPWHLMTTPHLFTNQGDYHFMVLLGGLYAAGIFPLVFLRRIPKPIVNLLLLLGVQFVAWFFVAQVARYLVSLLPLASVIAGYGWSAISRLDRPVAGRATKNLRLFPTLVSMILTGQVLFIAWAVSALPTTNKAVLDTGMTPTALGLGDVLKNATEPDTWEDYKARRLDVYAAMDWINRNTPPSQGVVLYDEPRGFYLDRPYLWGNRDHSSYIPYDSMKTGKDLTDWLLQHNYHYVLINLNWSPDRGGTAITNGKEMELLRDWYEEKPMPGTWRFLLADALRRGLWTPTSEHTHGVVVLEVVGGETSRPSTIGAGRTAP